MSSGGGQWKSTKGVVGVKRSPGQERRTRLGGEGLHIGGTGYGVPRIAGHPPRGVPPGGLPPPVSQQWRPGRRPLIVPPRNLSLTRGLPCLVFDCLSNTARRGASARHVATCGQSSLLTASSPIDPLPQPGPRRYFPRWFPRSFSSPPVFPHLFPFRTPPVPHRLYPFRTPSRYFHLDLLLPSVYPHSYALSEWKKGPEKPSSPSVSLYSIRDERKLYFLPQSTRTFLPPP